MAGKNAEQKKSVRIFTSWWQHIKGKVAKMNIIELSNQQNCYLKFSQKSITCKDFTTDKTIGVVTKIYKFSDLPLRDQIILTGKSRLASVNYKIMDLSKVYYKDNKFYYFLSQKSTKHNSEQIEQLSNIVTIIRHK